VLRHAAVMRCHVDLLSSKWERRQIMPGHIDHDKPLPARQSEHLCGLQIHVCLGLGFF